MITNKIFSIKRGDKTIQVRIISRKGNFYIGINLKTGRKIQIYPNDLDVELEYDNDKHR